VHAKVSDAAGRSDPHQFGSEPFCLLRSLQHGHPEDGSFDALSLGLYVPLSMLRVRPHERPRMTRGRCGWLGLHRNGLSPSISCRFLRRTLTYFETGREARHVKRAAKQVLTINIGGLLVIPIYDSLREAVELSMEAFMA